MFLITVISVGAQSKSATQLVTLYHNYIAVKSALASDNADESSKAAIDFVKTATTIDSKIIESGKLNTLKTSAKTIAESKNIDVQRKSFYRMSDIMITLAKTNKLSEKPIYIQYCPMAEGSWLSNEKQITNPYYGSSMLTCGSVKSEIK